MPSPTPYTPRAVFSVEEGENASVPRVLIAPNRYIQGDGILDHLGRYLTIVPSKHAAILISEGGQRRVGARLLESLKAEQIDSAMVTFNGECSLQEIERVTEILKSQSTPVDCVVAVGGGKCVDAGKCIAYRLGVPVVVCPSLLCAVGDLLAGGSLRGCGVLSQQSRPCCCGYTRRGRGICPLSGLRNGGCHGHMVRSAHLFPKPSSKIDGRRASHVGGGGNRRTVRNHTVRLRRGRG